MTSPKKRSPIGEINGPHAFMFKLFLISWPVFLTSMFGLVAYSFHWGTWVSRSIHHYEAFVEYGPRFSDADADALEKRLSEDHRDDMRDHVQDLHRQ